MAAKKQQKKKAPNPKAEKPAKPKAPRKKQPEKTAAEMNKKGGDSSLVEAMTKGFNLVLSKRLASLAVMRNEQVSKRANLIEERKDIKGQLEEKQTPAEFNRLAGKLLHTEQAIAKTKTQEKAAVEGLLRLTIESVGGDLFDLAEEAEEQKAKDKVPGQLSLGDAKTVSANPVKGADEAMNPLVARVEAGKFYRVKGYNKDNPDSVYEVVRFNEALGHVYVRNAAGGPLFEMTRALFKYDFTEVENPRP